MAIIPSSTRFVGIAPSVNLTEKKSNQLNSETQPYTMQDFQDSISPDLSPIVVDGNSVGIDADPTVTLQQVAVIESLTTNAGIVLKPNGTGAIMAQVPDGTATGGNARGTNAVDLQMSRSNADQVASANFSSILGGRDNRITSTSAGHVIGGGDGNIIASNQYPYNCILGGQSNSISGSQPRWTFIGGGQNNSTSSQYGVICGGVSNTTSSSYSTISGGASNTASSGTFATVVGGYINTASGQYSVAGGYNNVASGQGAVAFGYQNLASGQYSVAGGNSSAGTGAYGIAIGRLATAGGTGSYSFGYQTTAGADYSFALGRRSRAYLRTQIAVQSVDTGGVGQTQYSTVISSKYDTLSSAATTVLSLDGTGTANLIIPDGTNRAWNVTVKWVAVCTETGSGTTAVGDVAIATDSFMFKKVSGTSSIGTVQNLQNSQDATMAGATCSYAVGGSQDLQITFTAPASANATTFRVVAKVELTEVAW